MLGQQKTTDALQHTATVRGKYFGKLWNYLRQSRLTEKTFRENETSVTTFFKMLINFVMLFTFLKPEFRHVHNTF
jgi:hypothetical protein